MREFEDAARRLVRQQRQTGRGIQKAYYRPRRNCCPARSEKANLPHWGPDKTEITERLDKLQKAFGALEALAPRKAGGGNYESPWMDANGDCLYPSRDLTDRFRSRDGILLWKDFPALTEAMSQLFR